MKSRVSAIERQTETGRAVQDAASALELNRGRLTALVDVAGGAGAGGGLGFLMRHITGVNDIEATLRPLAEKHPFGVLAAGAAAGGLACLALPRLAAGLIVPILWSEGRQLLHGVLHGWLNSRAGGHSGGPA